MPLSLLTLRQFTINSNRTRSHERGYRDPNISKIIDFDLSLRKKLASIVMEQMIALCHGPQLV
jgi:hypothetical protein